MYLGLDNETGGFGSDKSLLSTYLGVFDDNFNLIDELDLLIKPDDGVYIVNAEALGINGINLVKHDPLAKTYSEVKTLLYEFLKKNSREGAIKLVPIGHNVRWDIQGLTDRTLSKKSWDQFVGYRVIDTGGIAMVMMDIGMMPKDMRANLGALVEFFGVEKREAHTAKGDVLMTVDVYKEMRKRLMK